MFPVLATDNAFSKVLRRKRLTTVHYYGTLFCINFISWCTLLIKTTINKLRHFETRQLNSLHLILNNSGGVLPSQHLTPAAPYRDSIKPYLTEIWAENYTETSIPNRILAPAFPLHFGVSQALITA